MQTNKQPIEKTIDAGASYVSRVLKSAHESKEEEPRRFQGSDQGYNSWNKRLNNDNNVPQ